MSDENATALAGDNDRTPVYKRALALLTDQCNELEGANRVLAQAIRDIEAETNCIDSEREGALGHIRHICQTGGVKAALEAS